MSLPENNQVSPELAKVLQQLVAASEPRFVRYELGNKKSLFLVNPLKDNTQIYYADRFGRVLLGFENSAILNYFSEVAHRKVEIIDIPKEQSKSTVHNLGLHGFHANQELPQDDWLKEAKDALKTRSGITEIKEENVERYTQQQQQTVMPFFATPSKVPKAEPTASITPTKKL